PPAIGPRNRHGWRAGLRQCDPFRSEGGLMHVITFDGEERHVHHSDRECAWCGEPSPFADYCSAECHGKGEHKSECDTCHELVACDHECAGRGDHQRTMYSLECPGCERHPIAYRSQSFGFGVYRCKWIVS